jgi:hypothetical protein
MLKFIILSSSMTSAIVLNVVAPSQAHLILYYEPIHCVGSLNMHNIKFV